MRGCYQTSTGSKIKTEPDGCEAPLFACVGVMVPLLQVPALINAMADLDPQPVVLVGGAELLSQWLFAELHAGFSQKPLFQSWSIWVLRQKGKRKGHRGMAHALPVNALLYRCGSVTDLIPEPGHGTCVVIMLSPDCSGLVCKQLSGFLQEPRVKWALDVEGWPVCGERGRDDGWGSLQEGGGSSQQVYKLLAAAGMLTVWGVM